MVTPSTFRVQSYPVTVVCSSMAVSQAETAYNLKGAASIKNFLLTFPKDPQLWKMSDRAKSIYHFHSTSLK